LPSIPAPYPGYRLVWPYSYKFFKKLRDEKVDIIHSHQPFGIGLAAMCLAIKMRVPFVYSFHTLFSRYVHNIPLLPKRLSAFLISTYLTWFCNQADVVIVGTKMVRRYLKACGVKTSIEVIPTGVNIPKLPSCQATKLPKTLLYTGRLSKEKNIPFLLEAFPEIEKQEPDIQLILVGGGPLEEEIRQQAKEISPKIIVTGQKSREEVLEYCHNADIFVYASRTETQGLVLTEAKACGLPIVAVFSGALVDVIRSGVDGYLVAPNQEKFVVQVVSLLRNNVLREEMSKRAIEDIGARFSEKTIANRFEAAYEQVLNQGR